MFGADKTNMTPYEYKCPHEDCKKIEEGIRKCKQCNRLIITNRGIDKPNMFISTEWGESS